MLTLLIVVIVFAIAFDYINGFHDAANSIATIVSTRVLSLFMQFFGLHPLILLPIFILQTIK